MIADKAFCSFMNIKKIIQRLKENDEISRKFHQVETSILSVLNFKDLFDVLLSEISDKFKIPFVWLTIIDNSEVSNLIQFLKSSNIVKERLNIIPKNSLLSLINNEKKPLLINENLKPYFKLFPPNRKYLIRSMSVIPILLDGEIIGSLNQADTSPKRFEPGINTTFLEQLAIKVSLCMSNVTAHEKLKFLAFRDPLTELMNRRAMENILDREFRRAKRYNTALSVVFLDLNDFKSINDKYGHQTGDKVLRHLSKILIELCRDCDIVCRYAGDEFVIILPETTLKNAEKLMIRAQNHLRKNPLKLPEAIISPSISFGAASSEDHSIKDFDSLLKKSDKRLYRMKEKGPHQAN